MLGPKEILVALLGIHLVSLSCADLYEQGNLMPGSVCRVDHECWSGRCYRGFCTANYCADNGNRCVSNADCCSGYCAWKNFFSCEKEIDFTTGLIPSMPNIPIIGRGYSGGGSFDPDNYGTYARRPFYGPNYYDYYSTLKSGRVPGSYYGPNYFKQHDSDYAFYRKPPH